jgi:hypothetical protein
MKTDWEQTRGLVWGSQFWDIENMIGSDLLWDNGIYLQTWFQVGDNIVDELNEN